MKVKNHIILFFVLLFVWLLLNSSFGILVFNVIVLLMITLTFCSNCNTFKKIKLTSKSFFYTKIYVFDFSGELMKSSFNIVHRIITPPLLIYTRIVTVKTKLKPKIGRLILANPINITPRTLTINMKLGIFSGKQLFINSDYICIHND